MSYHKSVQGVGWVSLVPSGTYPDPVHLAEIESLDLNITEEDGDLEDSNGDIIDSFTVKRVIEGTIALKDISGSLLAAITRGVTVAAGTKQGYAQTSVIPTTPFQITVTEGATFADDLGVIDLTAGKAMICAATSTGTNVYAVNTTTGQYTFNTADAGHSVLINYRSTKSTTGTTSSIASATASQAYYGLHCYQVIAGKPWGIYVPAARLPGLSAKFGKGGWSDTTLKFKATKDGSNNFVHIYLPE
jgi:hypothetical protein